MVVPDGGGELKDREGAGWAEGVDGFGDGADGLGAEYDRDGAEDFGDENERLPELKPLEPAASAGIARTPSVKTRVTARASKRLAAAQGRMVPHPSAIFR